MANQHTKRKDTEAEAHLHIALGKSNEELQAEDAENRAGGKFARTEGFNDAEDKRLFDRREDPDFDPWSEVDPLTAAVDSVREPGFAYKLLSDRCCDVLGGTRGYEPVKTENGDKVTVGNMFLGKIPQRIADKRQKRYQQDAIDQIKQLQADSEDRLDKLKREAKELGVQVLSEGDSVENLGDGQTYGLGITVERGDRIVNT